jgi:hypothetical protein
MPRRPKDSPPPDPRQIIDDQARQIEQLREDLLRSEIERNRLRRENERLKEELDMARRRANRQAAPFSRGLPKADPERPGRKPGAAYGRKGHRPLPAGRAGCAQESPKRRHARAGRDDGVLAVWPVRAGVAWRF